jgi:hypothetical protein
MIYGPKSCLVVTLARWAVPTGSGDQIPPKSRTNTAFVAWYLWKRELGAVMFRIIYCLLLLGISICSMASVVWVLSFLGFELLLVAGGCVIAFASSVTLLEELVEWRRTERHRRCKDNWYRLPLERKRSSIRGLA